MSDSDFISDISYDTFCWFTNLVIRASLTDVNKTLESDSDYIFYGRKM